MIALLGAGGMGEVYRARDTRLGRSVAIKVLPETTSRSAEHRQRFEREARAIAALNHPNICTLHDVGRSGETDYLVMELVEGETLAARLQRGPLPPAAVLRIAVELATALARAHRAGILHRDLKPGNVMLTKTGAKLMDFGLARSHVRDGGTLGASQLPTQSAPITGEGRIVGTYQYMAPEQLEGHEADARSDLWALGATLYEMATGRRAFDGTSTASVISAIMREEPRPIAELAPMSPPGLDRLVRTCLAKEPDARWQNAADLARELEWVGRSADSKDLARLGRRTSRHALVWWAVLVVVASGTGVVGHFTNAGRDDTHLVRTELRYPSEFQDYVPASCIAVAPNGYAIVMSSPDSSDTWWLHLRRLDRTEDRILPTPNGALWPFWSPDSREIAFITDDGKLQRLPVAGGPARTICELEQLHGGSWGPRGRILIGNGAKIVLVDADQGGPREVTTLDSAAGEEHHFIPGFLPDGEHFLYNVQSRPAGDRTQVRVTSIRGGKPHDLMLVDGAARVSPDGWIVFLRDGVLLAQQTDAHGSRLLGNPIPLADQPELRVLWNTREVGAVITPDLMAYGSQETRAVLLHWLDREGKPGPVLVRSKRQFMMDVSPDGGRVIMGTKTGTGVEFWVLGLSDGRLTRLAESGAVGRWPRWFPDSRHVVFATRAAAGDELRIVDVEDLSRPPVVIRTPGLIGPTSVRGDGSAILLESLKDRSVRIMVAERDSGWQVRPYLNTAVRESQATFTPDRDHVIYASRVNDALALFCDTYPVPKHRVQLTHEPVGDPLSNHEFWVCGYEILYVSQGALTLRSLPYTLRGDLVIPGTPSTLFDLPRYLPIEPTADGQHFLSTSYEGSPRPPMVTVVQNWHRGLRDHN